MRRFAQAGIWPFRRFFDPRFDGIDAHVVESEKNLIARVDLARVEQQKDAFETQSLAREIRSLLGDARAVIDRAAADAEENRFRISQEIEATVDSARVVGGLVTDVRASLEDAAAGLATPSEIEERAKAAGLLEPRALSLRLIESGGVELVAIDPLLVAETFVIAACGFAAGRGIRVADVSADAHLLPLRLASIGFEVDIVGTSHLRVEHASVSSRPGDGDYSAVVAVGRLAHGVELGSLVQPGGTVAIALEELPGGQSPHDVERARSLVREFEDVTLAWAARGPGATWSLLDGEPGAAVAGASLILLARGRAPLPRAETAS